MQPSNLAWAKSQKGASRAVLVRWLSRYPTITLKGYASACDVWLGCTAHPEWNRSTHKSTIMRAGYNPCPQCRKQSEESWTSQQ